MTVSIVTRKFHSVAAKKGSFDLLMNNYKILLVTTIVTAAVILAIGPNNIQKTMAQSPNTINATPETNTS